MDLTIVLADPIEVQVTSVHPIDYDAAFTRAVDAALRLSRELQLSEGA